jgi:ATP-binding cassette, subfamily B (MDR/TAP), member 1
MSANKGEAPQSDRDEPPTTGEVQPSDIDNPPSPRSNADESKLEKASSQNDIDEKETSSVEPSDVHRENFEPAQIPPDPILAGPAETELALKKLDSAVPEKKDGPQDPFAHLPEHEAAILRKQVDVPEVKVGYSTLFRYATTWDWVIFVIAVLASIIAGAAMPLMTVSSADIGSEMTCSNFSA